MPKPLLRSILLSLAALASASLTAPTPAAAQGAAGSPGCPCLTVSPLKGSAFEVQKTNKDGSVVTAMEADVVGKKYYYEEARGVGCEAHDDATPPMCATTDQLDVFPQKGTSLSIEGTGKTCGTFGRPGWCGKKYCWVDPKNCAQKFNPQQSAYYPNGNIHYSYETCGDANTFKQGLGSATEMVTLVENYVRSIKCEVETNLIGKIKACAAGVTDMCSGCPGCKQLPAGTEWTTEKVDFNTANGINRAAAHRRSHQNCVEATVGELFQRIGNVEYDRNNPRLGYMYMGQQEKGSFVQWPAIKYCNDDYDPRMRPWYSIVASGPKDVMLVLDVSGSMTWNQLGSYECGGTTGTCMSKSSRAQCNQTPGCAWTEATRIYHAKIAAKAVLKTLTWVDYVSVAAFADGVTVATSRMVPATDANKGKIAVWIDGLQTGGDTNFKDALQTGMDYLCNARKTKNCWSSHCTSAMLFLSDGQPNPADKVPDYAALSAKNAECGGAVRIFTYPFGNNKAQQAHTKRIAEEFNGAHIPVPDGGALKDAMSGYYKYLIASRDTSLVRWSHYADAMTGVEVMGGCIAIDDKSQADEAEQLWGVVCVDVNILMALPALKRMSSYFEFATAMNTATQTCEQEKGGFGTQTASQIYRELTCDEGQWGQEEVCDGGKNCFGVNSFAAGRFGGGGALSIGIGVLLLGLASAVVSGLV